MKKDFKVLLAGLTLATTSIAFSQGVQAQVQTQNKLTLTINPTADTTNPPTTATNPATNNRPTVAEGGQLPGFVSRSNVTNTPLVVTLQSTDTSEARLPATITIPEGQAGAAFIITGVPDTIVDGSKPARIVASAPGYDAVRSLIYVTDNTAPKLTVRITSKGQVITGKAGETATGVVERNTAAPDLLNTPLTVNLQSTNTKEATVPATVIIPAGKTRVEFPITRVATIVGDGVQRFEVVATAQGFTDARAGLVAKDSEVPTLVVTANLTTIAETGGANAATGTVSRNTSTTKPLVVQLRSTNGNLARVPETVTIPAGAASVTFPISATVMPAFKGKTMQVNIIATTPNFAEGRIRLMVTH